MLKALIASLIALASGSAPTTGSVLFAIDHKVDPGVKFDGDTSSIVLFETGAWMVTGGKHDAGGRLDEAQLRTIRSDLARATWTVEHSQFHCMARALTSVDYVANGKKVWTARTCEPDHLDAESQKALTEIEAILVQAQTPPCCKH